MSRLIDRTGQRYGRLVVVKHAGRTKYRKHLWQCLCDCGKETVVFGENLGRLTNSCGCLNAELSGSRRRTHGLSGTKVAKAFSHAKERCQNPNNHKWADYGSRGIQFLYSSVEALVADIGHPPSGSHSIDRINTDGHYEPGNCRWATSREQNNNRRDNVFLTYQGRTQTVSQWARELGFRPGLISERLRSGWTVEKALTTPVKPRQ